jgi:hypothetical protein
MSVRGSVTGLKCDFPICVQRLRNLANSAPHLAHLQMTFSICYLVHGSTMWIFDVRREEVDELMRFQYIKPIVGSLY